MNKRMKYTLCFAGAGAIINGLLNYLKQLDESPNHPVDWSRVLKATFKGAGVAAPIGFVAGAYVDYQNDLEPRLNTDVLLGSIISELVLGNQDRNYLALCEKVDWLIRNIKNEFGTALSSEPFRFGSTEDGTALREKYDVDVLVSFKPDAFASISNMYGELESHVKQLTGQNGIIRVRRQTVSIGVFFDLRYGREGKVDLVPVKITEKEGNKTSGYLHKNRAGLFQNHSYQKTDTFLLNKAQLTKTQKKILVALKKWKNKEMVPLSSYLLKNLILDAYACNVKRIPYGITRKIIMVLSHIRDNIDSIHLTSIENSNNVLTNIPASNKLAIRNACVMLIDDFEYQWNLVLTYFK